MIAYSFNLIHVNRQEVVCNEFHLLSDPAITATTATIRAEENAYINESSGNNFIVIFNLSHRNNTMFNFCSSAVHLVITKPLFNFVVIFLTCLMYIVFSVPRVLN